MVDHSLMRLGKLKSDNQHVPELSKALFSLDLTQTLPDDINWSRDVSDTNILLNDKYGCCTAAGPQHIIQIAERWKDGTARGPSADDTLKIYKQCNPAFDINDPTTDIGARLTDVMHQWQTVGFPYLGEINRIDGVFRINPKNELHIRLALHFGGPLVIGALLPIAAQTQDIWTAPANLNGANTPESWGGHCMALKRWNKNGLHEFSTWGSTKRVDTGWITTYVDEIYMPVSAQWFAGSGSPSGYTKDKIMSYINSFTDGSV